MYHGIAVHFGCPAGCHPAFLNTDGFLVYFAGDLLPASVYIGTCSFSTLNFRFFLQGLQFFPPALRQMTDFTCLRMTSNDNGFRFLVLPFDTGTDVSSMVVYKDPR